MNNRNLTSSYFIGDLEIGKTFYHGAVQITPLRNNEYINRFKDGFIISSNSELSTHLNYTDPKIEEKKTKYGINNTSLVSQGLVFNIGFGLSVHDISFNVIANLGYTNLVFYSPVFEWDILFSKSEVIGKEVKKDGADKGAVQVKTKVFNQSGITIFEYVREVLIRAKKGKTYSKSNSIKTFENLKISDLSLPTPNKNLSKSLLGNSSLTYEEFEIGKVYNGTFEKSLSLIDFTWLQTVSMIDSETHHQFDSNMIGYGGAVKSICEGMISEHLPLSFFLAMKKGNHITPTYPADVISELYGKDDKNEKLRAYFEVIDKTDLPDRNDIGIITIKFTGEKYVTPAGYSALEKVNFKGLKNIKEENGERLIKVLEMEYMLSVPKSAAFIN